MARVARTVPRIIGCEVQNDGSVSFLAKHEVSGRLYPAFYLTPAACSKTVYVFGKSKVYHTSAVCFYHPTLTADHLTAPTTMTRQEAILEGYRPCRNCT